MKALPAAKGIRVAKNRVPKLMREHGLLARWCGEIFIERCGTGRLPRCHGHLTPAGIHDRFRLRVA